MTRRLPHMAAALLAVVAAISLTGSSSASYVSSTSSTGTVSAAADWVAPTVAVTSPGAAVRGTTTIAATASDPAPTSGLKSVTIQGSVAGTSAWTTICVDTTSPYSCDLDTTGVQDGAYDLQATAVDNAGNTTTSASVRTTVANSLTVVLERPGDYLKGTLAMKSTVTGATGLNPSVRVDYQLAGTSTWTALCTSSSAPYTCSPSTTLPNGTYSFRSVATVGSATATSATVANVVIDNLAPAVTMTDPGTGLKGTKTFASTATDAHSGVDTVRYEASANGTTWNPLCTATATPFSCTYDTTQLANGTYSFRAVATDKAGNVGTSAVISGKTVTNTVSTITLATPSPYLRGNVPLSATTTTNGTITSVRFEQSVAGSGTWTAIATTTSTTATYTTSWSTAGLNGTYDLRAVLTASDGSTVVSNVVAGRLVDNIAPKGLDIQTTNGGTAGRVDAGDTIVYTFSEQMDLSSIYSGWSGTATSGTARVGGLFGQSLDITSPSSFRLGTVDLGAPFSLFGGTASASISAATVTIDGTARTVVTVKILSTVGGIALDGSRAAMVWTPNASATDLAGNAVSTADVTESGDLDVDF